MEEDKKKERPLGSDLFVEHLYNTIIMAFLMGAIKIEGVGALAERTTELYNRLKEEQESGEQEG